MKYAVKRIDGCGSLESPRPCNSFIENAPKRENVGTRIRWPASGLLRSHIADGAKNGARNRMNRRRLQTLMSQDGVAAKQGCLTRNLRQTEIQNLDVTTIGNHQVLRFQIAMNNAAGMRR